MNINTQNGFIALTSVLILGAIFLMLIIGVTHQSVNLLQQTIAMQASSNAQYYAYSCADYALLQIAQRLHYEGGEVVPFGDNSCEILPFAEDADGTRTIHTQSTVNGYVHRVIVEVVSVYPQIKVQSYQSVVAF